MLDILTPVADGLPRWGNWGYVDYGKAGEAWYEIYLVRVVNAAERRVIFATLDGEVYEEDFTVRPDGVRQFLTSCVRGFPRCMGDVKDQPVYSFIEAPTAVEITDWEATARGMVAG